MSVATHRLATGAQASRSICARLRVLAERRVGWVTEFALGSDVPRTRLVKVGVRPPISASLRNQVSMIHSQPRRTRT
jgi:hypothetical protein